MFHLCDYNLTAAAAGATNSDMTAVADGELGQRNGHFTFTSQFNLLAASLIGASVIRGRFQVPAWNALGEMTLFNANRALTPPSNPQLDLYDPMGLPIPRNTEFQVQASNNLGAATEQENCALWVAPPNFSKQLPQGKPMMVVRLTTPSTTPTINVWNTGIALTFSQGLYQGVWSVVGAAVQGANAVAFRINFPVQKMYGGAKFRPGGLVQTAVGDVLNLQRQPWQLGWGEWGRFHTFNPPTLELLGGTAAATTYQVFLWLIYVGEDESILNNWASAGGL